VKLVLGGPGCGKTTYLLSEIDSALADGIDPSQIAFVSFTRKAAHEARDRAAKTFRFSKDDLTYFRTLHSLAFTLNGHAPSQLMSPSDWEGFAKWQKLVVYRGEEDQPFVQSDNRFLSLHSLSRLRMCSVRKVCVDEGAPINEVEHLGSELNRWKAQYGKLDFTDMISEFIARDYAPPLRLLIVDEAQDLSALQWKMVDVLSRRAERVIIAGDDDQAIFQWAGADVQHFLNLQGEQLVLPKSYRMYEKIHAQVRKISKNIGRRFEKNFSFAHEGGEVHRIDDFKHVDLSASTMFLGRTRTQLSRAVTFLREKGYPYSYMGESSVATKEARALLGWEDMRAGRTIDGTTANVVIGCLYKQFYKTRVVFGEQDKWSMNAFAELCELKAAPSWRDALIMPDSEREYYRAINKRGLSLRETPHITVNTIHSVKGGEADHVCLMTNLTAKVRDGMRKDPGSEARVFYVGASRARSKLYIHGTQQFGYEIPR
jgi:superfamily I DNA/RNA helicase